MPCGIGKAYPSGRILKTMVIVQSCEDLMGDLDAEKFYILDGVIDMMGKSITVPAGGLTLGGLTFDTSKLIDSTEDYTMFISPPGGSGNLLGLDYAIEVTGVNSKVYDIESVTGNEAFEFSRINYNDCTSLGIITGYRQGLELGTGRFGGSPSLTLAGTWAGGFRVTTSIVRALDNAKSEPLFKAGAGFTMASRFLTDINADLGTLAPLADFAPANFLSDSLLQLNGCIITRNGVADTSDATILPNIDHTALQSRFTANIGVDNTFVGGREDVTAEVETVIAGLNAFVPLLGTWALSDAQHFSSPASGQLKHLGTTPREFRVAMDLVIRGTQDEELTLRIKKYDDSLASFVTIQDQLRPVTRLPGGRDVAFMNLNASLTLDVNDYVFLEIANGTTTANVTAEIGSYYVVESR